MSSVTKSRLSEGFDRTFVLERCSSAFERKIRFGVQNTSESHNFPIYRVPQQVFDFLKEFVKWQGDLQSLAKM